MSNYIDKQISIIYTKYYHKDGGVYMHSFQPVELSDIDINPFNMIGTDLFALTAEKDGKVNSMTAGWGGFGVMWGKKVAYVVVRDSRYTKEFMDSSDTFSMSFFDTSSKRNQSTLKYLGVTSGRDEDKIANACLNIDYHNGTPYIDEARTVYICRKMFMGPLKEEDFIDPEIAPKWYESKDYHNLYIAEITDMLVR